MGLVHLNQNYDKVNTIKLFCLYNESSGLVALVRYVIMNFVVRNSIRVKDIHVIRFRVANTTSWLWFFITNIAVENGCDFHTRTCSSNITHLFSELLSCWSCLTWLSIHSVIRAPDYLLMVLWWEPNCPVSPMIMAHQYKWCWVTISEHYCNRFETISNRSLFEQR